MKAPTPENIKLYVKSIETYEEAIKNYYDFVPDDFELGNGDEKSEWLWAEAQAAVINMRAAWKNLSGEERNDLRDTSEAHSLLRMYIEDPTLSVDDFVLKLNGEPVSLETLAYELNDDDKQVTYKLLAEIWFRMCEYDSGRVEKDLTQLPMWEEVFETEGMETSLRRILVNALRIIEKTGNKQVDKE